MENQISLKTELTNEQLVEGLKLFKTWYPEEAEKITKYESDIIDIITGKKELDSNSELANLKFETSDEDEIELMQLGKIPECTKSIIKVVIDVIFFVWGLAGLHAAAKKNVEKAILKKITPSKLEKLLKILQRFEKNHTLVQKASNIWDIFSFIREIGAFAIAMKEAKKNMSFFVWLKTGIFAAAQITAWIASGSTAFIAEAVLCTVDVEGIVEDSIDACHKCKNTFDKN